MLVFASAFSPWCYRIWRVAAQLDSRSSFCSAIDVWLDHVVVLVNIYLVSQRKSLNSTRGSLIRELVYNQRLENLSLYDPLTNLFNRRAMDEFVSRK